MSWKHLGGCKPVSTNDRFDIYAVPVPEAGCWLWQGPLNNKGYAQMLIAGERTLGSRFSWARFVGPVPAGMCVCHKCDTPQCVNPDHLFIGTHADNMADRQRKGRQSRGAAHVAAGAGGLLGSANGNSRLTERQVLEIREDQRPQRRIAAAHNVSQTTVWSIKSNRTWRMK